MNPISRAQFLRGDWRGKGRDLRPPWALPEPAFSDCCDGCGECVIACKETIVSLSARKLPVLDFALGGCTFCGDCAAACATGALHGLKDAGMVPWLLRARISGSCLAMRGTSCVRCIEECEHGAIMARPALGGRTVMQVDDALCTGCGACVGNCPVAAVLMEYPSSNT